MAEPQLTGLQKRAAKYIDRKIDFQLAPGEVIKGNFIGFDKENIERAIIQLSNAADRTHLPLMSVVNYFEELEDAKND